MAQGLKETLMIFSSSESCHLSPRTFAISLRFLCSGVEERCQKKEDKGGNEDRKGKIGWYQVESLDALLWLWEMGRWRRSSLDSENVKGDMCTQPSQLTHSLTHSQIPVEHPLGVSLLSRH